MQNHSDHDRLAGIEREFRFALQALASEAEAQIAFLSPGCITCELYSDFDGWIAPYFDAIGYSLSAAQRNEIEKVRETLERIPDADFECFRNDLLERDSWQNLRLVARAALEALDWPNQPPPGFEESEPGVWRRP